MKNLFFIVGRGRSGTTLLAKMLHSHSNIKVAPEGFFVMNLYWKYRNVTWNEQMIDHFCHDLFLENRMETWEIDLKELRTRLREFLPNLDYPTACLTVYQCFKANMDKSNIQCIGDKNPHYTLFVEDLLRIFPESKFIFITRDFRDNILSFQKVPFDMNDASGLAFRWNYYNYEVEQLRKAYPARFITLSYEDLVQEPKNNLKKLCGFLNLSYDPKMLDFYKEEEPGFYGKSKSWFKELNQPLNAEKLKSWKEKMSESDIGKVEFACQDLGEKFGYLKRSVRKPMKLFILTLPGRIKAWLMTQVEKALFYYFPLKFRIAIINKYRSNTGRI